MDTLFLLHIVSNIMGVSCFLFCAVLAIAYLVHDRQLRSKHLHLEHGHILSLQTLDRLLFRMLLTGFVLLTMGLGTGMWTLARSQSDNFSASRAFAVASWCVFAWVLIARVVWGWRGRRAAFGMLLGCSGVTLALIGYFVRTLGGQ